MVASCTGVWNVWKVATQSAAEAKASMLTADEFRRTKLMQWVVGGLANALGQWQVVAFKRLEAVAFVDQAMCHWYDRATSLSLFVWRQSAEQDKLQANSFPCAAKYWKMAACTNACDLWRSWAVNLRQEKRTWGWRNRNNLLDGHLASQFVSTSRHLTVMTRSGNVITIPIKPTKKLPTDVGVLEGQNAVAIAASEHYTAAITSDGGLWLYDFQVAREGDLLPTPASCKAWDEAVGVEDAAAKCRGWSMSGAVADWRDWLEAHLWLQEQLARALFRWKHVQMSNHVVVWRSRTKHVPSPRSSSPRSRQNDRNGRSKSSTLLTTM